MKEDNLKGLYMDVQPGSFRIIKVMQNVLML